MDTSFPVYVVDDNAEMCRSLEALLESCGFDVLTFQSPRNFLDQSSSLARGVVLLDLRMQELNGLDVLTALGDDLERLPTIFITAHGQIDLAVKAIKLGAKDFLQKPLNESSLLAAIDQEMAQLSGEATTAIGGARSVVDQLSPREREVVEALARGLPNKVIANRLGLSVRTVEMHRARAMSRLQCRTFADLLRLVLKADDETSPGPKSSAGSR